MFQFVLDVAFILVNSMDRALQNLGPASGLRPWMVEWFLARRWRLRRVVPKKDGKICICGDYKVTINQALEIDQSLLPKPEDLLVGGKTSQS